MKFDSISLDAFGPFTGAKLNLSKDVPGLDLIFGPNEAGKSSTLRAISALLFGVPEQTQDTFIHPGKDLRISASISHAGRSLMLTRRKGRKQTLLDSVTGEAVADSVIEELVPGLDERLWKALYGLDHETLRLGAEALLSGHGALGESLFDAGLGSSRVRSARLRLRQEAESLFTRKARTKPLNQHILNLDRARLQVSERSTSATGYRALESRVAALQEQLLRLRAERTECAREQSELERLLRLMPLAAQRESYVQQRNALGPVPPQMPELGARSAQLQRSVEEAEVRVAYERKEHARLSARLSEIPPASALAELDAAKLDELALRLGAYRKAALDLPKRAGEHRALSDQVTLLLRRLGREPGASNIEELRLGQSDESKVRRLAREKTQIDTRREECAGKLKRSTDSVNRRKKELSALGNLPPFESLERSVMRAQKHVEQDIQLEQAKQRAAELGPRVETQALELRAQALNGSEIPSRVPNSEQLEEHAAALFTAGERRAAVETRVTQQMAECQTLRQALLQIEQEQVPNKLKLDELRQQRDECVLRGAALGFSLEWQIELSRLLKQSDAYADRLFFAAREVERRAALGLDLSKRESLLKETQQELQTAEQVLASVRQKWTLFWNGYGVRVDTESVPQMRAYVERLREFHSISLELERVRASVLRLESSLALVVDELATELRGLGQPKRLLWESLRQFVERAEFELSNLRQRKHEHAEATQRLEAEREQLEALQAEQVELKEQERLWRPEWLGVLKLLGLPKDSSSDQATETLDSLAELFRRVDELRVLEGRIQGMQRDMLSFESALDAELSASAPDLLALPVEARAEQFFGSCRKARQSLRERESALSDLQQRESALAHAELLLEQRRSQLAELMQRVGVTDYSELVALEQRAADWSSLSQAIASEERKLIENGEGASLTALLSQTAGREPLRIRQRVAALELERASCETQIETVRDELAGLEKELLALSSGAAQAAEEHAVRRAELGVALRRYVRVKLAAEILEQEIERYRKDHQAPVLRRASEIFARLTLGAYAGLDVAFAEGDSQVLVCRRADAGREVEVPRLSDGARDQLYLSLRIASLELSLARGLVCPVLLDDILVHFDDERAAAALSVLHDLAQQTQVLFFTHHARIVDIARSVSSGISLRSLPEPSASPANP